MIIGYLLRDTKDGEPRGEPYGSSVISEALKFKDENTVYVEAYDRDFTYELEKRKEGMIISFVGMIWVFTLTIILIKLVEMKLV